MNGSKLLKLKAVLYSDDGGESWVLVRPYRLGKAR